MQYLLLMLSYGRPDMPLWADLLTIIVVLTVFGVLVSISLQSLARQKQKDELRDKQRRELLELIKTDQLNTLFRGDYLLPGGSLVDDRVKDEVIEALKRRIPRCGDINELARLVEAIGHTKAEWIVSAVHARLWQAADELITRFPPWRGNRSHLHAVASSFVAMMKVLGGDWTWDRRLHPIFDKLAEERYEYYRLAISKAQTPLEVLDLKSSFGCLASLHPDRHKESIRMGVTERHAQVFCVTS